MGVFIDDADLEEPVWAAAVASRLRQLGRDGEVRARHILMRDQVEFQHDGASIFVSRRLLLEAEPEGLVASVADHLVEVA